jgi:integrase/recombinase XerD
MASAKIVLKKDKANANGEVPLYIRIIQNRQTKFTSLGIYVIPGENWNEKESKVTSKYPNATRVNNLIATKLSEANQLLVSLETSKSSIRNVKVRDIIIGKHSDSFIVFANEQTETAEKRNQVRTAKRYRTIINKLTTYLKNRDLLFNELTVEFLNKYETHLKQIGNGTNTIHTNMKTIRAILYKAIQEDKFPQEKNPFFKYKLSLEATYKERLNEDEIIRIINLEVDKDKAIYHAKFMFLLSYYCAGVRVGDMLSFTWGNIFGNELKYRMGKTKVYRSIPLHDKAINILELYKTDKVHPTQRIFPFLQDTYENEKMYMDDISAKTAFINKKLSVVAKRASIQKKLTSHIARHSFADIARKKGISVYDISKALGHSSIAITEKYLASLDDGAISSVFGKMFD